MPVKNHSHLVSRWHLTDSTRQWHESSWCSLNKLCPPTASSWQATLAVDRRRLASNGPLEGCLSRLSGGKKQNRPRSLTTAVPSTTVGQTTTIGNHKGCFSVPNTQERGKDHPTPRTPSPLTCTSKRPVYLTRSRAVNGNNGDCSIRRYTAMMVPASDRCSRRVKIDPRWCSRVCRSSSGGRRQKVTAHPFSSAAQWRKWAEAVPTAANRQKLGCLRRFRNGPCMRRRGLLAALEWSRRSRRLMSRANPMLCKGGGSKQ